jgi:hypothetical protein
MNLMSLRFQVPVTEFIYDRAEKRNENGIFLLHKEIILYFHT